MCTILVLHQVVRSTPLLVAANRDEFYARAAKPPSVLEEHPTIIAGRDGVHGGTWMGATRDGFFVGITNQRTFRLPHADARSRGLVAIDALCAGSREATRHLLNALDAREYNSFNLVYGDADGVEVAYGRRETADVEIVTLPPGLHVLTNDRLGSPEFPKVERAALLATDAVRGGMSLLDTALPAVLADHDRPPLERVTPPPPDSPFTHEIARELQAICIHTPVYGTRSATLLALGPGTLLDYRYAPGPPCTTPFAPVRYAEEP